MLTCQSTSALPRLAPPRPLLRLCSLLASLSVSAPATASDVEVLEDRVRELQAELLSTREQLETALADEAAANEQSAVSARQRAAERERNHGLKIGPVSVGGAVRVNYINGSYQTSDDGPSRGGHGGNVELDTFRVNLALDYQNLIGKFEYRWYPAGSGQNYNFLHTGWLGYRFDENSHVEVGINRVPFGAGPYGISHSWFFDQHYYVGLADDPDLGLKYHTRVGNVSLDLAYYPRSDANYSGRSIDSARYGYDAVRWNQSVDASGQLEAAAANGYSERDQFNGRAIYHFTSDTSQTDLGLSLQQGKLKGTGVDDGRHWAASVHWVHRRGNLTLASQLSRYRYDVDDSNPWGGDDLIPMGAYDFAWPVASDAWVPAVSASYKLTTGGIPWLDYVLPYLEWSSIMKNRGEFNDSQLFMAGAAWSSGGWYIYTDLAYANGNYFIGDEGDDYSRLDGIGDFGVNGNDRWRHRFNINFGYYY